jgi:hypothetical protein
MVLGVEGEHTGRTDRDVIDIGRAGADRDGVQDRPLGPQTFKDPPNCYLTEGLSCRSASSFSMTACPGIRLLSPPCFGIASGLG